MGVVKYTGPVASFHCPTNAEIRSLKVHFSPKQEGTGDPSPENVREIVGWDGVEVEKRGKNLYKVQHRTSAKANYTETNSGLIVSSTSDGTYCGSHFKLLSITSKNIGQTFTFSAKCISATQAQRILLTIRNSDNSHFRTVFEKTSDYVSTFTVPNDFPKDGYYQIGYYCTGAVSTSGTTEYSEIQLELGSKATSYEPCQDETIDYEFGVLGKNKVPFLVNSKTISVQTNGNAGWCNIWKIPNRNLKYTYSAYIDNTNNTAAANVTVWLKNIDNTSYVDGTAKSGTQVAAGAVGRSTITLDASILNNTYYFLFGITSFIKSGETVSCTFSNPMVEIGDTATTYEPYNPKNTVYGGWIDLISGEVQEGIDGYPYDIIILDGTENWILVNQDENTTIFRYNYRGKAKTESKSICSHFKVQLVSYKDLSYPNTFVHGVSGNLYIQPDNLIASTVDEFKNYLSTQYQNGTPVTILFKENNTINTYHLAPTELQTFLGQNNVWSNADYVEVEYDLHETQDILARKQFIVANQPHLVSPAAAPLQNFVTDMVAPLKECKVYFSPVQEGEGDPSPDNIRAISGWNEMTISQSQRQVIQDATNEDWTVGWLTAGGMLNASASYRTSDYIPVLSGTTVKIKFTNQTNERAWYCIAYYDSQKKFLIRNNQGYITEDITCTVSYEGLKYIRISINRASDVLISIEPITTYLIDWSSTSTVYGGYIDLLTGEVWKTLDIVSSSVLSDWLLNRTSLLYESGKAIRCYCPENGAGSTIKWTVQCTHFSDVGPVGNWAKDAERKDGYVVEAQGRSIMFIASDLGFTTKEEWAQWMVDNNVQYVYPLAAPVLITTLTPTQLKTLRGTNNIWSSANDKIEIRYFKH